jgi:8-oxo-dGTP diphosphatase
MHVNQSPRLTVDIIIQMEDAPPGIVLVKRRNVPLGWALPGGFVDYGETVEKAAAREALEETSLKVKLIRQFHVYSDPRRDPRGHTVSVVFLASAKGEPVGADDAAEARVFEVSALPGEITFDHRQIIQDYLERHY